MASMQKIPMYLRNFFPHALDKTTHPALGKFPTKGEISLTMTNSVVDPEFHKGNLKYRGKWLRA
jgi:hypothetical protein